jgi:hypothetical protein
MFRLAAFVLVAMSTPSPSVVLAEDSPVRIALAIDESVRGSDPRPPIGLTPPVSAILTNTSDDTVVLPHEIESVAITLPDGEERTADAPRFAGPIVRVLAPHERVVTRLGLDSVLATAEPGRCVVRATVEDARGRRSTSNALAFDVADVAPIEGLELRIEAEPGVRGRAVHVTFRNRGEQPVRVVDVQDGSIWGMSEVRYWFLVTADDGRIVTPNLRCGLIDTTYRPDTLHLLAPGAEHEQSVALPFSLLDDRYRIRLHYVVDRHPPTQASVTVGRATSNEIVVDARCAPAAEWESASPSEIAAKLGRALETLAPESGERHAALAAARRVVRSPLSADEARALRQGLVALLARSTSMAPYDWAESALAALVDLADESCASTFERLALQSFEATSTQWLAVRGLEKVRGRAAVVPLVRELERIDDDRIVAIATALSMVAGHAEFARRSPIELPDGSLRYDRLATPDEFRACKGRWLAWWHHEGEAWVRGATPK